MKILSSSEILACYGAIVCDYHEQLPCTCYKQGSVVAKYNTSMVYKMIMCDYYCCNKDGADSYKIGCGGDKCSGIKYHEDL